jgi:hypothetical protein
MTSSAGFSRHAIGVRRDAPLGTWPRTRCLVADGDFHCAALPIIDRLTGLGLELPDEFRIGSGAGHGELGPGRTVHHLSAWREHARSGPTSFATHHAGIKEGDAATSLC